MICKLEITKQKDLTAGNLPTNFGEATHTNRVVSISIYVQVLATPTERGVVHKSHLLGWLMYKGLASLEY